CLDATHTPGARTRFPAGALAGLTALERAQSVLREVLDRLELRRQIVVEIRPAQRCVGEACDRRDGRAQSVLVGLDVGDTESDARRVRMVNRDLAGHNQCMAGPERDERPAGLPLEVLVVWVLYGLVAGAIVATYSRIPARELYHVSHNGLAGGFGRVLVSANFSAALVAIAVLAILFDRVRGRLARSLAVVAAVLCAAVFWPGVVSEADLD